MFKKTRAEAKERNELFCAINYQWITSQDMDLTETKVPDVHKLKNCIRLCFAQA